MITVEKNVVIGRSAEDVFAYVSDQTNAPRWQDGLLEVRRTTDGPIGIGTRHTFVRTFMGRRMEGSNEYTQWEPNRVVAFRATSGPVGLDASYAVEPAGTNRARLTSRLEMRAPGLLRLAEPLMAARLRRDVETNLANVKDLLEANAEERSVRGEGPGSSWGAGCPAVDGDRRVIDPVPLRAKLSPLSWRANTRCPLRVGSAHPRGSEPRRRGRGAQKLDGPSPDSLGPPSPPVRGSFSSTKMTCVSVSPMFSPECSWAASQRVMPGGEPDVHLTPSTYQAASERAEGDHYAVGVAVRGRTVSGPVAVFEHAHAIVLHYHAVEVWVGDDGIELHWASRGCLI
jgi:uncharacterized membrane protein